jgi:undecaprenyl-diphosphatase
MTLIHAIILGIVEGITEFLPISSTAHLMMTSRLLGLPPTDFLKTFEISIQLSAILAVIVLYSSRLQGIKKIWPKIVAAFLPTAIIGFVLYKFIKGYLLGNDAIALWALGIGGVIIILFELLSKDKVKTGDTFDEIAAMPYSKALLIGLAQAVAVIPGVSRSAATIIAGRALGLSRRAIIEFTFILAIPTMAAATGYDLVKSAPSFTSTQFGFLAVGFIATFFSAYFSIKWLIRYIQSHNFIMFGFYRIIIALLFIQLL